MLQLEVLPAPKGFHFIIQNPQIGWRQFMGHWDLINARAGAGVDGADESSPRWLLNPHQLGRARDANERLPLFGRQGHGQLVANDRGGRGLHLDEENGGHASHAR